IVFDKRFLRHVPRHGKCGEESVLFAYGEVFRTVITEIEIDEIPVVVVIGKTACQSLVPSGYPILDIATDTDCFYKSIAGKPGHGPPMMVACAIPVVINHHVNELTPVAT